MLIPMNRRLVVEPILEQKKESGVLIPEEYRAQADHKDYALVKLTKASAESSLSAGTNLVVPSHMVEEIDIFGEIYHVVLENHVIGFFDN
jgi:co-chaperonin GroES (HSP10)